MPEPSTGLIDAPNRADQGPPAGGPWATGDVFDATSNLKVVSNTLQTNAAGGGFIAGSTYGPNCECGITHSAASMVVSLYVRLQQEGAGTVDGYQFKVENTAGNAAIFRLDNGAQTMLGATFALTAGAGDSYCFQAIGSTLYALQRKSGTSGWSLMATRTDSTYTAAGHIGLGCDTINTALTNYFGGTVYVTGPAPTHIPFMR